MASNFKLPTVAELKRAARDFYGAVSHIDVGLRQRAGDPDVDVADINQWQRDEDGNKVDLGDIYTMPTLLPVADELRRVRKLKVWPVAEQWDLYCYDWTSGDGDVGLLGNATLTFNADYTWTLTEG